MKKRVISLLLVICLLISLLPVSVLAVHSEDSTEPAAQSAVFENPFRDIKSTDWYYDAVQYAAANGFFKGTSETEFSPDGTMTRGMFVTVLARMAGVDTASYSDGTPFTDVSADAWYAPAVVWAAKYGITSGMGNGAFAPDATINREQMAAFFVRYFEAFDVNYETGADVQTVPADLDSVSGWAQDAVLKLWKQGLLNGDGKSFAPSDNATRAQTASLGMRVDKAVETWYSEPGVESQRVSVDPAAPAEQTPATKPSGSTGGGSTSGSGSGTTTTTYYEVKFAFGDGQTAAGVTLPETKTYVAGTPINTLPTPSKPGTIFLGWYYDADMNNAALSEDTVNKNMTLYAKMGDTVNLEVETPNYVTVSVPADKVSTYSFAISDFSLEAVVSFVNVTAGNKAMTPSETVTGFEAGQTYRIELAEDSKAVFVLNDIAQPHSVRVLNIVTEKTAVDNLTLNSSVKYIAAASVTNMSGTALDGLFSASLTTQGTGVTENKNVGTFTYSGSGISVGDTVAIYSGTRPDQRGLNTANDGAVAYVEITAKHGTGYSYKTANIENVLFTPDILPVSTGADIDGQEDNHSITVPVSAMDYSADLYAEMGLDALTTIDEGDYIAFYTGTLGNTATKAGYAMIDSVTKSDDTYTITYSDATEDDILAVMDLYTTRNEEVELTDEQKTQIESDMENQALESGFVEEAAEYLTALALETDGFRELSDDLDWDLKSYNITFADGAPVSDIELQGVQAEITKKEITATIAAGKVLKHFEDSCGIRAELAMTFTVKVGEKLEINLQAIFEQEVLINVNASGGAIWKWAWIIPYIDDYQLNANIDMGTFTGIGITATAKTKDEKNNEFNWEPVTKNEGEERLIDIGTQITELMEAKETFLGEKLYDENGEEIEWAGSNGGGLLEKYAAMMEDAEESWVDIVRVNIFETEGTVDPLHILCYGVSADFVVKANLYVTMGMTFEYGVAKRYNFSLLLFEKQSSSQTIDLEEAHYNFDFYVMGTAGVRAGVELEVGVGLFSLNLDSIGICAEVGAYAELWGYFYYHCGWTEIGGRESSSSGAMAIEIGLYLTISFKAQLFSSDKLTYQPTLYDNQWPLLTIGSTENVYDFAYDDDDSMLNIDVKAVESVTLPTELFTMNYMDLKSGDLYGSESEDDEPGLDCDDETESRFIITMSNSKFSYDAATNTVTVNPGASAKETCEMTIVWKNGSLAFTSKPISRTVSIHWSNPENARYIAFNSNGGSNIPTITGSSDSVISAPANPTKIGYTFEGWFSDSACTQAFSIPENMPDYPNKGVVVYAKWAPSENTPYTVEHYVQNLNGTYTKANEIDTKTGTTDANTAATAKAGNVTLPDGTTVDLGKFTPKTITQKQIAPNGSTVVKVYYNRNTYTVQFTYGTLGSGDNTPLTYTAKYGATVYAPNMVMGGYDFKGFSGLTLDENGGVQVLGDASYAATWAARNDTPYRVEHYIEQVNGNYLLAGDNAIEVKTGETGSTLSIGSLKITVSGLTFEKATVNGSEVSSATIGADGKTIVKLYYERNKYTFKLMDGSSTIKEETLPFEKVLTIPVNPTRTGHAFAGWYTDSACSDENAFSFENAIMPAADLTLYAKWTANGYAVTLNTDGGTIADGKNVTAYTYGVPVTLPTAEDMTKTGHSFAGWYTNSSFAGNAVSSIAATDQGDKTFYAKWTPNEYNVTLHTNDAAACDDLTEYTYGVGAALPTPTKTGYDFAGWYADSSFEGDAFTQISTSDIGAKEFWAKWTASTDTAYRVEHYQQNANDDNYTLAETDNLTGTTGADVTAAAKNYDHFSENTTHTDRVASGTVAADGSTVLKLYYDRETLTVNFDSNGGSTVASKTFRYGQTFSVTAPTREDYAFDGWYNGTVKFEAETVTEAMTLTAHWKAGAVNYTVEHYVMDTNGGYQLAGSAETKSGTVGDPVTLNTLKKDSLEVAGGIAYKEAKIGDNVLTEASIVKDMTVKLYYERSKHNLGWVLNDGTASNTYTAAGAVYYGAAITAPSLTKTGYSGQWATAPADTMPANDVTYTMIWTVNQYTITFNSNGGTAFESITQDYGTPVSVTTAPTREGYDFEGWNPVIPETMPAENITLTAVWAPKTYSVTLNTNGGTIADGKDVTTYTHGTAAALPTPTRTGYTFNGWYEDAEFTGNKVDSIADDATGDKTFWAKWSVTPYTISYDLNGGAVSGTNPTEYNVESDPITLINPTKANYTFAGWTGTDLSSAETDVTIAQGSTGDRSYAATWTPIAYNIEYHLDGGINNGANPATYTVETETFYLADPTKAGYRFDGWFDSETGGTQVTQITQGSTGDITLYAKWTINQHTITWNYNGGKVGGDTQTSITADVGSEVEIPAPTREPTEAIIYTFDGWYTQPTDGDKVDGPVTVGDTDKTYYAHWTEEERTYTVTWVSRDVTIETTTGLKCGDLALPNAPVVSWSGSGYFQLKGWYTKENSASGTKIDANTIVTADMTYYAIWEQMSISHASTKQGLIDQVGSGTKVIVLDDNISLTEPLTISRELIIDGDNHYIDCTGISDTSTDKPSSYRAICVSAPGNDAINVEFRNLTLRNCKGGFYFENSNVTMKNVTVTNCNVTGTSPALSHPNGAAIYAVNTAMNCTNCNFMYNTTTVNTDAGAVYLLNCRDSDFSNCTFTNNAGDALRVRINDAAAGYQNDYHPTININNCTFTNNTGFWIHDGSGTIYDFYQIKIVDCQCDGTLINETWPMYEINYQSGSPDSVSFSSRSLLSHYTYEQSMAGDIPLIDATAAGYTFDGWYWHGDRGNLFKKIPQGTIGSLLLYASWTSIY